MLLIYHDVRSVLPLLGANVIYYSEVLYNTKLELKWRIKKGVSSCL